MLRDWPGFGWSVVSNCFQQQHFSCLDFTYLCYFPLLYHYYHYYCYFCLNQETIFYQNPLLFSLILAIISSHFPCVGRASSYVVFSCHLELSHDSVDGCSQLDKTCWDLQKGNAQTSLFLTRLSTNRKLYVNLQLSQGKRSPLIFSPLKRQVFHTTTNCCIEYYQFLSTIVIAPPPIYSQRMMNVSTFTPILQKRWSAF